MSRGLGDVYKRQHLSRENNVPEIARLSAVSALGEIGAKEGEDYRLYVSKPENDGGLIVL